MRTVRPKGYTAWLVLITVSLGTAAGIYAIHKSQQTEREVIANLTGLGSAFIPNTCNDLTVLRLTFLQNLHKGVIRDQELYRMKLAEQRLLKQQQQKQAAASAKQA